MFKKIALIWLRAVGIADAVTQVFARGSYTSTTAEAYSPKLTFPPITYIRSFHATSANEVLGVGIGAFETHVSLTGL